MWDDADRYEARASTHEGKRKPRQLARAGFI